MIVLSVAGIKATASQRPEGYAQDVLSKGRLRADGFVEFEDDVFASLVAKYSPGARMLVRRAIKNARRKAKMD
ncbi:MAG: hypothetical protein EBR82_68770 [Caulobacteraceae bacterium]|nr:hypothetical protein [Caulobacteraceae bacterium]